MVVDVLGTKYHIIEDVPEHDAFLDECDGYCDKTTKKIVVKQRTEHKPGDIDDFDVYRRKCLRHEIIHAFLFESGLHENWEHKPYGHDETYVDWIATQFPKLRKAFEQAGCVD